MADRESIKAALHALEVKKVFAQELVKSFGLAGNDPAHDSWAPWVYVFREVVDDLADKIDAYTEEVTRAQVG